MLSEVQRVASRIGVLREGRLIAVDQLDALRAKSLHHVEAQFGGAQPLPLTAFAAIAGVRNVRVDEGVLRCDAPQAALDPLLKEIARHPVVDLTVVEAELEETFLAYYSGGSHVA